MPSDGWTNAARRGYRHSSTSSGPTTTESPSYPRSPMSPMRTYALDGVARTLAAEGALSAWRDERYAVAAEFGDAAVVPARARRGALLRHPHVRGARQRARPQRGRHRRDVVRAPQSRRRPSIPAFSTISWAAGSPRERRSPATVIKEAWEEAGIAAERAVAGRARGIGARLPPPARRPAARDDLRARPVAAAGLRAGRASDDEVVAYRRVDLADAARLIANTSGERRRDRRREPGRARLPAAPRRDPARVRRITRRSTRSAGRTAQPSTEPRRHAAARAPAARARSGGYRARPACRARH